MSVRKITSMTMFVSFLFLVLTSVVLYIVPQGRVAYWADWHMWGLTKTEWGNLHINLGFLFLFAGLLHMYYNWAPIKAYMKNRAREMKVFTPAFNVALFLTLVVGLGTYLEVPPMSSVIDFGDSIKDKASKTYGEPPYGHAELSSLKLLSKKQGLDLAVAMDMLTKAGIEYRDSGQNLADIAKANGRSPQQVYAIIKDAGITGANGATKKSFPDSPMAGFGNKNIASLCAEFDLMFPVIRRGLAERGVKVEAAMTVKEIAAANDREPMEIFEILHEIINGQ